MSTLDLRRPADRWSSARHEVAASGVGGSRRSTALVLVVASLGLAVASLLLPSAPGYDPWSWLIWGREVVALELDTREGPAWKPLPVLLTAALTAVSEELAPAAWLVIARTGAILAVFIAFSLAKRLAGGSIAAGLTAAAGVMLVPGWIENAAVGNAEGLLTALGLLALASVLERRLRAAFALLALAALVRVEVWPFLALAGAVLAWRDRAARIPVALAAVAIPSLWLVPELLGSGELLRSADRARVPNPGAPTLADRPALATLATGLRLPPPVAVGGVAVLVAAAGRPARASTHARSGLLVAGASAAWILLVAGMSELGFSGEGRYLLPGAAVLCVPGAAGLFLAPALISPRARARAGSAVLAGAVAATLALIGAARWDSLNAGFVRVSHGTALANDLGRGIDRAGGAPRLLRCGPPYVGPYRGPMAAWALGVPKSRIGFDASRPGVALRSRLGPSSPVAPARSAGELDLHARTARWEIAGACRR